jgi:hypothetical protein
MERRIRPIDGACRQTVFDRVVVDVFDMSAQVVLVDDAALPETTLPDAALATRDLAWTQHAFVRNAPGERRLQARSSSCIVGIAVRQGPNAMEMVRQHCDRDEVEWQCRPGFAKREAKRLDVRSQDAITTMRKIHREETGATRHP